jgi:hypothetical protein
MHDKLVKAIFPKRNLQKLKIKKNKKGETQKHEILLSMSTAECWTKLDYDRKYMKPAGLATR